MTKDDEHRIGETCRRLLADDDFKFVIAKVREDITNAWMRCELMDESVQMESKMALTGLDLIVTKVTGFSDNAKMIAEESRIRQERIDKAQTRQDAKIAKLAEYGIKR